MHIKIVKGVGLLGNSTSPTTLIILKWEKEHPSRMKVCSFMHNRTLRL